MAAVGRMAGRLFMRCPISRRRLQSPSSSYTAKRLSMTTIQEIEKAIELLPLADQLRLYRDLPHLIGRDPEDLEWQRLAIEEFFKDDSPDDAVYDAL